VQKRCNRAGRSFQRLYTKRNLYEENSNVWTQVLQLEGEFGREANEDWSWWRGSVTAERTRKLREGTYKVVQIWPGLIVCKQVTVCPGHIWTTLYIFAWRSGRPDWSKWADITTIGAAGKRQNGWLHFLQFIINIMSLYVMSFVIVYLDERKPVVKLFVSDTNSYQESTQTINQS
jgi:hypothetical protein